ncbi:unnamed protein product, partial [Aphanomyces euteiches]
MSVLGLEDIQLDLPICLQQSAVPGRASGSFGKGLAAHRTKHFPYVMYFNEDGYQKPAWLARQDEQTPNLQGMYIAGSGSVRAILRVTGEEVVESDVSG